MQTSDKRPLPEVHAVFQSYPQRARERLLRLRELVFDTAAEIEGVDNVEETLKWGEPSYLTTAGSTIRIAWKPGNADRYGMYFHCQTTLIETFRELYSTDLHFEGNRAIVFGIEDALPVDVVKHCISLALTYHHRKHLPMLGAC